MNSSAGSNGEIIRSSALSDLMFAGRRLAANFDERAPKVTSQPASWGNRPGSTVCRSLRTREYGSASPRSAFLMLSGSSGRPHSFDHACLGHSLHAKVVVGIRASWERQYHGTSNLIHTPSAIEIRTFICLFLPESSRFSTLYLVRGQLDMNTRPEQNLAEDQELAPLLAPSDVAKCLGVSSAWVRDHATRKTPRIPAVKVGKLLRFRPVDIREFIRDCWSGTAQPTQTKALDQKILTPRPLRLALGDE